MNTAGTRTVTDQVYDRTVGNDPTEFFPKLIRAIRAWWPTKTAPELAAVLRCEVRSAERYLAGDRTPSAEALANLIKSEHGPKVIALIAADMPPKAQAVFWREVARMGRRVELLEERARLDRELAQVST